MNKRTDFLESIADTIKDYRQGDIVKPDVACVDTWVKQFDESVQLPVLKEMDKVLKKTYFPLERVKAFLRCLIEDPRSFVEDPQLIGDEPCAFWRDANFLDIQKDGEKSQKEMRNLFNELLKDKFGFSIAERANASDYVYLDDVICTGYQVRKYLTAWIKESAPAKAKLHVIVIASHTGGQWYARDGGWKGPSLQDIAAESGKDIKTEFWRPEILAEAGLKKFLNESDVLLPPRTEIPKNKAVQAYDDALKRELKGRDLILRERGNVGRNSWFSSDENKILLEREFLSAGARIRQLCPELPEKVRRPLGGTPYPSFGFGSLIVTFRNCPNTAPLALWVKPWDGLWYPLFPRVTNTQSGGM